MAPSEAHGAMITIFAVSDATGRTVERLVRSALTQFQSAPVRLVRKELVRTPEQVRLVVQEAAGQDALIVHTLVSTELRRLMLAEAHGHGVEAMDIMGPLLDRLAARLKLTPQEKPGLFEQLTEAKAREIEAVEFAFHHDDGQNVDDLHHAEIVLVGPSRTMKTPTTLYLAYRGWFAANVPLVPGLPIPPALVRFPADRVFCLLMAPGRLMELRRVRAEHQRIPADSYLSPEQIRKELLYAEQTCVMHGWHKMDVTAKSVEELGQEIISWLTGKAAPRTPPHQS